MELEESSASSSSNEHSPSHSPPPSSSYATTPSPKRKAGRKKFQETRHPVYRGVRQRKVGKWVCELREPQKKSRIWLGTFPTPDMAARAHDVAAIALRGETTPLNFPDSAWALPRPRSASPDDIRRAASKAAEMFRPSVSSASASRLSERLERVSEVAPPAAAAVAVFLDEEELFNMPGLLNDMAAGLLLTPPSMQKGFDWNEVEFHMDTSLWRD